MRVRAGEKRHAKGINSNRDEFPEYERHQMMVFSCQLRANPSNELAWRTEFLDLHFW